jgi:hypothetical protein
MGQTRADRDLVGSDSRHDEPGGGSIAIALTGLAAMVCASGSLFRLAIPLGAVAVGLGRSKLTRASATGEGIGRAAAGMVIGGVALVIGLLLLGAALLANPSSSTLLGLPPSIALPGQSRTGPELEFPPETEAPGTVPPETSERRSASARRPAPASTTATSSGWTRRCTPSSSSGASSA